MDSQPTHRAQTNNTAPIGDLADAVARRDTFPVDGPPRYCLSCDYDLRGIRKRSCPECGRPFVITRPRTWAKRDCAERRRRRVRHTIIIACCVALAGVFAYFVPGAYILILTIASAVLLISAVRTTMQSGTMLRRVNGKRVYTEYNWPRRRL